MYTDIKLAYDELAEQMKAREAFCFALHTMPDYYEYDDEYEYYNWFYGKPLTREEGVRWLSDYEFPCNKDVLNRPHTKHLQVAFMFRGEQVEAYSLDEKIAPPDEVCNIRGVLWNPRLINLRRCFAYWTHYMLEYYRDVGYTPVHKSGDVESVVGELRALILSVLDRYVEIKVGADCGCAVCVKAQEKLRDEYRAWLTSRDDHECFSSEELLQEFVCTFYEQAQSGVWRFSRLPRNSDYYA